MKTDVRTSVALLLFAVSASAMAQGPLTPPQPDAQPPQPSAPPQTAPPPPPPAQSTAPVPQNTTPVPQSVPPAPQQSVTPPPAPPASSVPQSPPPPSYPPSQRSQYPSSQQSPPPPQYPSSTPATPPTTTAPPPRPYAQPQWAHSESTYSDSSSNGNAYGFQYHPFRFHVDGGTTITQRQSENYYDNGWNAGAGLTWYPTSLFPLGLRVDGTYNDFGLRHQLLAEATQTFGTQVDRGTQKMWGGDTDLELDLHLSPYMHAYLLAGGGWYRQQTTYRDTTYTPGFGCGFYGCGPGYFRYTSLVAREETGWHFAPNAGFGLEFAMGPRASFFAEARYMRISPNQNLKWDYIPIKVGFRF
jgi:Outer membrane protein beta-barrel domain